MRCIVRCCDKAARDSKGKLTRDTYPINAGYNRACHRNTQHTHR